MRLNLLWYLSAVALLLLLRFLLDPLMGESNAAFLAAGAVIASTLLGIEYCRTQDQFETDRLLFTAQLTYFVVLISLALTITHLLVQAEAGTWRHTVVFMTVLVPLLAIAHLLCRVSFSAAEIRAAYRRDREARQRRALG